MEPALEDPRLKRLRFRALGCSGCHSCASTVHAPSLDGLLGRTVHLQDGRSLDLQKLQDGVDAMIESITRNPTAFTWLKELKRKDNYAYHHALSSSVWAATFGRHLQIARALMA